MVALSMPPPATLENEGLPKVPAWPFEQGVKNDFSPQEFANTVKALDEMESQELANTVSGLQAKECPSVHPMTTPGGAGGLEWEGCEQGGDPGRRRSDKQPGQVGKVVEAQVGAKLPAIPEWPFVEEEKKDETASTQPSQLVRSP
eukprot:385692-Karenia_brevis.AAC.1